MKHCALLVNVCIIMVVVVAIVKLSEAQISNTNRPECQGIFDFYFVLDSYVRPNLFVMQHIIL